MGIQRDYLSSQGLRTVLGTDCPRILLCFLLSSLVRVVLIRQALISRFLKTDCEIFIEISSLRNAMSDSLLRIGLCFLYVELREAMRWGAMTLSKCVQ